MQYARLEVRFARGGWSSGALVTGVVGDGARAVVVRPSELVVTHTLLKRLGHRTTLPAGSQRVGDARAAVGEGSVRLARGAVVARDGRRVGSVSAIWCDRATGRVRHLLIRPSGRPLSRPGERVLAADLIAALTPAGVELRGASPELAALPAYRPDRAIETDLQLALSGALAAPSARRAVKLLVEDGHVHVGGTLETEAEVASVRQAVAGVSGVREVVVDLVAIETLGARVERALAAALAESGAAETGADGLHVLVEHGIVYLEGRVATKDVRAALERATLAVAGARVVVNYLEVEPGVAWNLPQGPSVLPREAQSSEAAANLADDNLADDNPADDNPARLKTGATPTGDRGAPVRAGAEARPAQR